MAEIPLVRTAAEVRLLLAGADEIRVPLDRASFQVRLARNVRSEPCPVVADTIVSPGTWTARMNPQGAVFAELPGNGLFGLKPGEFEFVSPFGVAGDVLWVQEPWRSWEETCDDREEEEDHVCVLHCRQTYVAYEATPREGFRPVPDRARITYLDASSPLEWNRRLLGPWSPAADMPRAAARLFLEVIEAPPPVTMLGWCERTGPWFWTAKVRRIEA